MCSLRVLLLVVGVLLCVTVYQTHYNRCVEIALANEILRGYWHIEDDVYLLIDGSIFQIIDLQSMKEHFVSMDAQMQHKGTAESVHTYNLTTSDIPTPLTIELDPVHGMLVARSKRGEVFRAIRDNEMSLTYTTG